MPKASDGQPKYSGAGLGPDSPVPERAEEEQHSSASTLTHSQDPAHGRTRTRQSSSLPGPGSATHSRLPSNAFEVDYTSASDRERELTSLAAAKVVCVTFDFLLCVTKALLYMIVSPFVLCSGCLPVSFGSISSVLYPSLCLSVHVCVSCGYRWRRAANA